VASSIIVKEIRNSISLKGGMRKSVFAPIAALRKASGNFAIVSASFYIVEFGKLGSSEEEV